MSGRNDDITAFLSEWTAAEQGGDTAALESRPADDFAGIGPLGFTLSKQDWLERHATGALKYEAFRLEERSRACTGTRRWPGRARRERARNRATPVPGALGRPFVLVRQSGAWRLAVIHMSFIAGAPGAPPIPGRP